MKLSREPAALNRRSPASGGSDAAWNMVEALEQYPHVGISEERELWKAYRALVKHLGGKPMRKWWDKRTRKHPND